MNINETIGRIKRSLQEGKEIVRDIEDFYYQAFDKGVKKGIKEANRQKYIELLLVAVCCFVLGYLIKGV